MKPLIILFSVFLSAMLLTLLFKGKSDLIFSGNLAMSVMLAFTAMGHFLFPKGMAMMIPKIFPFKKTIVYISGVIEILAAIGLMIPSLRHLTALLLLIFFIAILPANIQAARDKINFEKASNEGKGISYLWFRVPLQVLFIGWVLYFSW